MVKKCAVAALMLLFLLASCKTGCNSENTTNTTKNADTLRTEVPVFNADSAYLYVKAQVEMGPRVPNSAVHKQCGDWLEARLKGFGAQVHRQEVKLRAFDGTMLNARNIVGSFNPDNPVRVMLCSHWDSRPWADNDADETRHKTPVDAANDGASGVGVLLEIARILQTNNPGIGVDIVFFDAEDYGEPMWDETEYNGDNWGLGSQYWAKNPHKAGYTARFGILLDMVGVENGNFAKEAFSMQYAPDIVSKVWSAAFRAGYGNYFPNTDGGAINDDHLYVNKYAGIPTIDIIHHDPQSKTGFFPWWHTTHDTMEHVDKATLKAVGQTLLTVLFEEGLPA